jgi:TonB family protein
VEKPVSGVGASIVSFKILLVEHDAASAERIGGALRNAGHQLFTEMDTARVLESLDRLRPDVALVTDGLPGMPGAALCMRLKKTAAGSTTPVVFMTAKVPQGEEELSRRLELLGCDRIIDQQTSSEQLLEICQQIVGTETKGDAPKRGPSGPVITQELPKVRKNINRDASSAESFDDAIRSAFTDAGNPSDGLDIEAHLDSVFSMGLPVDPATPPAAARLPSPAAPPSKTAATESAPVNRPTVPAAEGTPAPQATVSRPAEAKPATPKPTAAPVPAKPQAQAKPVKKPAESTQPVARHAPKAIEQLRLPRVSEIAPETSVARRWLWPVVGLVGASVVVGSLAVAYFVFLGGGDNSNESPQVARASLAAPTPTPAPPPAAPIETEEPVEADPLPEPPPLDDTNPPLDPRASTQQSSQEETPLKVVAAPPKPRPKAESPPVKTEKAPVKTTSTAAAAAAVASVKAEPTPNRASTPTKPAAASPEPIVTTAVATPEPKPESTPPPAPLTQTPPPTTTPTETPEVERAEPEPTPTPVAAEPVVVAPEVLQRVEPSYSAKAVKGLDNPVIALRVLVDQQGKIARVLVDEGIPGSELEGAAISAVLRWRFRPATEDGVPVKAWTTVRFVFQN